MRDTPFFSPSLENHEVTIAAARLSDVHALTQFIKRNASVAGPNPSPMPETVLRSLIQAENIVCARTRDGRMLGYYAINQLAMLNSDKQQPAVRAAHNVLCNRYKLSDQKVSFGAHALIDISRQVSDLRSHLLRALLRQVGLRYRYLFTVIEKDDKFEMQILPGEGWRCFHEEDAACYMMLDIAKALRLLASSLILQAPQRPAPSVQQRA